MNRTWTAKSGEKFRVRIKGLYDFDAGILGLTDAQILNALKDEKPLLIGNRSHAMVQVSAAYVPGPMPRIYNIGLADPWPGRGLRGADDFSEGVAMHRPGGNLRYLCLPEIEEL